MSTTRRGSLVDHRFDTGRPFTIGIEEEYLLLDPASLDLVQHAEAAALVAA